MQLSTKIYKALKNCVYSLDHGKCHICRHSVDYKHAVLDHIIPVAIYGRDGGEAPNEYWNLRLAHKKCNLRRSNGKIAGQIRLPLPQELV